MALQTVTDRYLGADSENEDYLILNDGSKSVAGAHIPSVSVADTHMALLQVRTCGPVLSFLSCL